MTKQTFAAFFSYVHKDDVLDNGYLSHLRKSLEQEVQGVTGEEFEIFQDLEDIHWGHSWEERLNSAIDGSSFLIAVITPRYMKSDYCRQEFIRFLEREKKLIRNDLILPILYIDTNQITNGASTSDLFTTSISSRQWFDWRNLRHEPLTNTEVRKKLSEMARMMQEAINRYRTPNAKDITTSEMQREHQKMPKVIEEKQMGQKEMLKEAPSVHIAPQTLTVDQSATTKGVYTTINAAMKAAKSGTRILIRPGTYKETLVLDKALELIGIGRIDEIIIQGYGGHTLQFRTEFGRVANLSICQVGGGEYYAVDIVQGRLDLEDCNITSQSLACVAVHNNADPRLRRNKIHDGKKGGIYLYTNGKGTLEENEIFNNEGCNILIETYSNPTLRRNWISGSGILIRNNGQGVLEENIITNPELACVEITSGGYPILRRNLLRRSLQSGVYVHHNGGGIFENNELSNNKRGNWNIDESSHANVKKNGNSEK